MQQVWDAFWAAYSPTTMSSKLSSFVILSSWLTAVLAGAGIHKQIRDLIKSNSPLLQYPTQVTQDIVPKGIHSHNDCASFASSSWGFATRLTANLDWRDVPLLTALSYGVGSVEADVWLFGDDLLVRAIPRRCPKPVFTSRRSSRLGMTPNHSRPIEPSTRSTYSRYSRFSTPRIQTRRTLGQPPSASSKQLLNLSQSFPFVVRNKYPETEADLSLPLSSSGIFDTSSSTSLNLLVDVKTDGARYVHRRLYFCALSINGMAQRATLHPRGFEASS